MSVIANIKYSRKKQETDLFLGYILPEFIVINIFSNFGILGLPPPPNLCFTHLFRITITKYVLGVLKLKILISFGIGPVNVCPIRRDPGGRNLLNEKKIIHVIHKKIYIHVYNSY